MSPDENTDRARTPAQVVPTQTRRRIAVPPADRIVRQIEAMAHWNAARRMRENLLEADSASRLNREVARRQGDILRRTQQAITTRVASELARQGPPLLVAAPTAVIAHGHAWFADKVAALLWARGVEVVECTDNAADALGAVVAEQPDIVLCGDRLAMMPADVLLSEISLFAPHTLRAVQAGDPQQAEAWLSKVDVVFVRQHPPDHVADALGALCFAATMEHDRV